MSWIVGTAYAMGGAQPAGAGGGDIFTQFMPFILIFVVFYFLLIRPQQKKAKEHKAMLEALKRGDAVITAGGLLGRILDVDGDVLLVDIGETKVKVGRAYLAPAPGSKPAVPAPKKDAKKGKKGDAPTEASKAAPVEAAPVEAAPADVAPKADDTPVVSGGDKDKPVVQ